MLSNTHFSMAVHVLSVLAYLEGKVVGSEDLARSVETNPSFLRGLIGVLRDAALVETRLGKGGGTLLARPASRITLYDVYLATESQPALKSHECNERSECSVAKNMVKSERQPTMNFGSRERRPGGFSRDFRFAYAATLVPRNSPSAISNHIATRGRRPLYQNDSAPINSAVYPPSGSFT